MSSEPTSVSGGLPLRRVLRTAAPYAARRWQLLLGSMGTAMLAALAAALTPWPLKVLVDNVLQARPLPAWLQPLVDALPYTGSPRGLAAYAVGSTVLLFLASWLVGLASASVTAVLSQRMTFDVAADLFDGLQRLSLRFHAVRGTGDAIRRVTVDAQCVASIVLGTLLPVITALFTLVTMLLLMLQLDASLVPYAFLVVPLMVLALRRCMPAIVERSIVEQDVEGRLWTSLEQTLAATPVVQSFVGEQRAAEEFDQHTGRLLEANLASTRAQLVFRVAVGASAAAVTALIFWVGAGHVLDGTLTLGGLLVFLAYLGAFYGPLDVLVSAESTVSSVAGSVKRVMEVLTAEPDVADRPTAQEVRDARGHLEFRDVHFGYGEGAPVLKGISFEALPGETVAVVGPSGAGKTTLVSLVSRFFDPDQGSVLLDGHDLRDLRLESLRSQVSLVLQEPFLFPISIADNIAYGRPGCSRVDVERAARAANAHEFVCALPDGYDTVVGERGATLSGGQRQRISIARALLKDAPVLVLDEPTSALDVHAEASVLQALDRLVRGRTTMIIAHRLSTIRNADTIVVMDDGCVVEVGSHRELAAAAGAYAALLKAQRSRRRRSVRIAS